ncbi:MAG: glycerate kinase [Deltaproteobacteria bacterium]|nr:glycerate kinase [Deltaproteobacteria bacterium]
MKSRQMIKEIFKAALNSALPENLFRNNIRYENDTLFIQDRKYPLDREKGIHVFGSGKAAIPATKVLEDVLQDNIAAGLVVSNYDDGSLGRVKVFVSAHPVPDHTSLQAADLLIESLAKLSRDDFFIYVLSGGSSSLVEKPMPPLTLQDIQDVSKLLLQRGMAIGEMNVLRKHLSLVKGGKLGLLTKAKGVVLVISDVVGDDLESIGSAPLYYDKTSYFDAYDLSCKYGLWDRFPAAVRQVIERGLAGDIEDTPKYPSPNIEHLLVGSNMNALKAAKEKAESLGLKSHIMTSRLRGEAREVAKAIISIGEEIMMTHNPFDPPVCLLFGGETTVTVRGTGKGGRNQEMCLAALKEIAGRKSLLFLSAGTDGIDGNSGAAGALVDHRTYEQVQKLGRRIDEYLYHNDSYGLLEQTGDVIITGPTGTNVMDITILLIGNLTTADE